MQRVAFFYWYKSKRIEGGDVSNEHNLRPYGKGKPSESEERETRSRAGKSGETRRRKATLRKTMNKLLTRQMRVDGMADI